MNRSRKTGTEFWRVSDTKRRNQHLLQLKVTDYELAWEKPLQCDAEGRVSKSECCKSSVNAWSEPTVCRNTDCKIIQVITMTKGSQICGNRQWILDITLAAKQKKLTQHCTHKQQLRILLGVKEADNPSGFTIYEHNNEKQNLKVIGLVMVQPACEMKRTEAKWSMKQSAKTNQLIATY